MKIIRAIMEDTIMGQEKYTAKTLAALQSAQQIAAMKYHQEITSAHVLLALAKEPEGLLATIFEECQTDMPMLKARLEQELAKIERQGHGPPRHGHGHGPRTRPR